MAPALLVPWVIRVLRLVLVSICCSTWLYITSCWVNWLESIGLVGSWFFSWRGQQGEEGGEIARQLRHRIGTGRGAGGCGGGVLAWCW